MATQKTPPLTQRQQVALPILAALLSKLGDRILDAHDGEVYRNLSRESLHCADVFLEVSA